MATAKQLKSGSWCVRVYDNELKKQVCFTSKLQGKAGKAEAELMAREYQLGKKQKAKNGKTVGECIDEYINLKENVLSPTTIAEYRRCREHELNELGEMYLNDISAIKVQEYINKLSLSKKPKTVRNAHGLLAATLNVFAPTLKLTTTLPKVQKKIKHLPDVKDVMGAIIGTEIELPCMLAMWCTLRMSEVRGIKKSDIRGNVLTIHNTKVTVKGHDVEKEATKTYDSTRILRLPEYIMKLIEALPPEQEYLTELPANGIYVRFQKLLKKNNIEHMTFHDLRHLNASVMVMLGIPDKYAMERGGWSSPAVLQSVYQHTFTAERKAVDDKIDSYFNDVLATVLVTEDE